MRKEFPQMNKKSFHPRLINILTIFVFCLLLNAPIHAQQNNNSGKSLADLFEDFKTAGKAACGERDDAIRAGKEIVERFSQDELNQEVIEYVKKHLPVYEEEDKECKKQYSLETLFDKFKTAQKSACGQRNLAIAIGKKILFLHSNDELNQDVIKYVKLKVPIFEKEDRICIRNADYDNSYKTKNWRWFFIISKEIIEEEKDKPLALDVMLTLVSVGYNRAAVDDDDTYNDDTIDYAKKAIELIESGMTTQMRWGVYEPFKSREDALKWSNYIIGYLYYYRLKEKKKALAYFYKLTQYNPEYLFGSAIYQAAAIYYFNREPGMASSLAINKFVTTAMGYTVQPVGEENNSADESAKIDEMVGLYKKLVDLYKMRFNLEPGENVNSLEDYIQKLINRPLPDEKDKDKDESK